MESYERLALLKRSHQQLGAVLGPSDNAIRKQTNVTADIYPKGSDDEQILKIKGQYLYESVVDVAMYRLLFYIQPSNYDG